MYSATGIKEVLDCKTLGIKAINVPYVFLSFVKFITLVIYCLSQITSCLGMHMTTWRNFFPRKYAAMFCILHSASVEIYTRIAHRKQHMYIGNENNGRDRNYFCISQDATKCMLHVFTNLSHTFLIRRRSSSRIAFVPGKPQSSCVLEQRLFKDTAS